VTYKIHTKEKRLRAIHVKWMQEQVKKEVDTIAKKIPVEPPPDSLKSSQQISKAMQDAYCRLRSKDCWLTLTEAAEITGVHKSTISRWAEKNMLENNGKRGRDRRFSFASVAFVKLHRLRDQLQREQSNRAGEKMAEALLKDLRPKFKQIIQELKDKYDALFGLKTKDKWITLEQAGIGKLHPHMLRHTYLTRLYNVEKDLRFVQDQAGHASPTTTAIYAKTNSKARKRQVEALDEEDF